MPFETQGPEPLDAVINVRLTAAEKSLAGFDRPLTLAPSPCRMQDQNIRLLPLFASYFSHRTFRRTGGAERRTVPPVVRRSYDPFMVFVC